jgi:anti-anti-sigma factor
MDSSMNQSHFTLHHLDDAAPRALRVRHDEAPDCAQVTLIGEFDLAGVEDFYNVVDRVCSASPDRLVIDVAHLRFCDSSGVSALAAASRRCESEHIDMRVVGVGPMLASVFAMMQADDLFAIEPRVRVVDPLRITGGERR